MITNIFGIITVLIVIEGLIFFLSELRGIKSIFNILPTMFWIYFLPLLAATFGLIPQKSEVYPFISTHLLPVSLILLLLSVDLPAVFKIGGKGILIMLSGSLGIILGGPIILLLFKPMLPEGIWAGFGALSASWTGGSANMLAVKEGLNVPDKVFLPLVIVDSIVPYVWMGILIALAGLQSRFDRWNRVDANYLRSLTRQISNNHSAAYEPITTRYIVILFALGFLGAWISLTAGKHLPIIKNAISDYTWTIILASIIGLLLSFTPARKLEAHGASKIGFAILYFVLASIGARANLADLRSAPVLIAAGLSWVLIHAIFILLAGRLLRAPLFLMATASQANVGGVASTPVLAAVYQPGLAPVGLLLAILGNIFGTYMGILCGNLCRIVSEW
jgi:uncharacterized membrane protein